MIVRLPSAAGSIEVVCGSMFSGKTQELIRRLRLAQIAKQHVEIFNSKKDTRYGKNHIISHDLHKIPCHAVKHSRDILKKIQPSTQVVGIDEVQFFDKGVVKVAQRLADDGIRVICAGLDTDYRGEPFDITAHLIAVSEFVTKNLAICISCGAPANRTQRLSRGRKRIEVGTAKQYEARCRRCFSRGEE